jgi:two-component system chemotaxis response regulator CheV
MSQRSKILLETGTNELEIIEFSLQDSDPAKPSDQHYFGINVAKVREIIRVPNITHLPRLPKGIIGIINLREQITPILDLGHFLFDYTISTADKKLIIARFNNVQVGFLVNDVRKIHRLSWEDVETPEAIHQLALDNSSVVGIVKREDRLIMMLDIEKIIAEINPQLGIKTLGEKLVPFGEGKTVLVAEDSPMIRKMIVDKVRTAGFNVLEFSNGRAAWEKLDSIANSCQSPNEVHNFINLVITDIEMPRMDGYTLCKEIKQHHLLAEIPVVIFSSMITEESLHKGHSVGADYQVTKPQLPNLLDILQNLLNKAKAEAVE